MDITTICLHGTFKKQLLLFFLLSQIGKVYAVILVNVFSLNIES